MVGVFSVVYANYTKEVNVEISANTNIYNAGGNVTGRVNQAPANLKRNETLTNLGIQQYDIIQMNTYNDHAGKPLSWLLIAKETYTDYAGNGCTPSVETVCNNPEISAWFAYSNDPIDYVNPGGEISDFIPIPDAEWALTMPYVESNIYTSMNKLNVSLSLNETDKKTIAYRNYTPIHKFINDNIEKGNVHFNYMVKMGIFSTGTDEMYANAFTPTRLDYRHPLGSAYWSCLAYYNGGNNIYNNQAIDSDGSNLDQDNSQLKSSNVYHDVRAAIYLSQTSIDNIVFSISQSNTSVNNTISIINESGGSPMKPRSYNSSLTSRLDALTLNTTGTTVANNSITKGTTIYLKGNANSYENSTASILVFDPEGRFLYYMPLEPAKGEGYYAFDTNQLPVGSYQISMVNEVYNEAVTGEAKSSLLSDVIELKVVDGFSNVQLSYTPQSIDHYEYGKNVSNGTKVASAATTGSVAPYTYSLIKDDTVTGHDTDHTKFTINSDGNIVTSEDLNAGEYYFKVRITDANGATIDSSQVLIKVEKATPTISFDSGATTKNVAYVSGETWQETITHTNTDTGDKVSFTSDHSDILSAARNSDQEVTLQINNQNKKGTVVISATLKETANYNSVSATKTVFIYDDISDFKFTPSKDKITTKDTENIGYHIGTLSFKDGLKPFAYSVSSEDIAENADRNKFRVDDTAGTDVNTMNVFTTQKLGAGTYKVRFKVANQYQAKYVNAIITVSLASQTTFSFHDYEDDSLIPNGDTKQIKYQTPNASVIAKGGESDGAITYQIKDGQAKDILTVDSTTGKLTMMKTGTVIIQATKAGNNLYEEQTIEMSVEVVNGTQSIVFDDPFPNNVKFVKDKVVNIPATLTRENKTKGDITYRVDPLSVAYCVIEDETIAKVKLLGIGTCTVIASNEDSYYEKAEEIQSINIYASATGSIVQEQDYVQGDDAIQANSGKTIAKVTGLSGGGDAYTFQSITVKKNNVEVKDALSLDQAWEIKPLKTLTYGRYKVEVVVEDAYGDTSTITGDLVIGLEENTDFVITKDSTVVSAPLEYDYMSVKNGFQLGTQGKKGTGTVQFTESGTTKKDPNEADPAIEIDSSGFVSVNRAMKKGELYEVYAYVEADTTAGYARQETTSVKIIIQETSQNIEFVDVIPTHQIIKAQESIDIQAETVRTDGTKGAITYTVATSSKGICEIKDETIGKVTMLSKGTCIVTASNSDANYESKSVDATIELYDGITGKVVQTKTFHQGDEGTLAGATTILAEVTSLSGGGGANNYQFKAIETTGYTNTKFNVDASGNITAKEDLKAGTYTVVLSVKDGYGGTSYINGTITILAEENDAFQLIYKDGTAITDDIITSDYLSAVSGIRLDTTGKKGTGAVKYLITDTSAKDPDQATEALKYNPDGTITDGILIANRAMTSNDTYQIQAVVEADASLGLAQQNSQIVTVKIERSNQEVVFQADVPESKKFVDQATFEIPANTVRNDQSKGAITYTVANESVSICEIKDPTKPEVTMLSSGDCIVRAENDGEQNFKAAYKLKKITLYDAMSAKFRVMIQSLKQGDAALDPAASLDGPSTLAKIVNVVGSEGTIKYSMTVKKGSVDLTNSGYFEINDKGEIKPSKVIGYGTYDVVVTLVDDRGDEGSISVSGQIVVGLEENTEFYLTYKDTIVVNTIEETYTNPLELLVETTGKKGSGKVYYEIVNETVDPEPDLMDALTIDEDGFISVHRATKATEVYKVYAYVKEDTAKGYARQETKHVTIKINKASMSQLSWTLNGVAANRIEDTYKQNKQLQLGIRGLPAGANVTYYLDADEQGEKNGILVSDVVSIDEKTGLVTILHANTKEQINQVVIKAKVICDGYEDQELPGMNVQIHKAEQKDFAFVQSVYIVNNGSGSLTPRFIGGVTHDDGVTNNIVLRCDDAYDVRVDPDDERTLRYQVNDQEGAEITIKATNLGNRDYKPKEASAILKVLGAEEDVFDVDVSPSKDITYGDDITLTPRDTGDDISYEYIVSDPSILTQAATTKESFHASHIGTTQIKVIKHETGKQDAQVFVTIRVKPKQVQVEVKEAYTIKTGEALPDFELKDFASGDIIHGDVIDAPQITVNLLDTLIPGTYPIHVQFADNAVNENYHFVIKDAFLTITQDQGADAWLTSYLASDTKKTKISLTNWYNEPVMIESIHSQYQDLSQTMTTWTKTMKFSQEGEHNIPVYFKNSMNGAITSQYDVVYRLDFTGPQIREISAKDTNTSTFAKFMNALTLNTFYKPGVELTIKAEDVPYNTNKSSGVKELSYQIYTIKDGKKDALVKEATITESVAVVSLEDAGEYRVCASSSDHALNPGKEVCEDINVKRIDIDIDQDEYPDLNDSDHDGCPDLNIKWYDQDDVLHIINGDRDYDGLPDLNIDANGDGKADLNIDTDHDGLPDLNLVDLAMKASQGEPDVWTPTQCVVKNEAKGILETYCTGTNVKAEVNVDLNGDLIPDINIVTKGNDSDTKWIPNINVTKEGSTKPYLNLVSLHVWEPKRDLTYGTFAYDTMDIKPVLNIDTDQDGLPDLNLDIDGDGSADLNIDIDGDGIPDTNIDTTGDGKPDLNIDVEKDGIPKEHIYKLTEWKPEKVVHGLIEYDTMEILNKDSLEDQGIIVENPEGTFLPNFAIKVNDVTAAQKESITSAIKDQLRDDQEVKVVYDVTLFKDQVVTQPDGTLKVKIPIPEGMKHPKLLVKNAQGDYELVDAQIEDGYLVYETAYVGLVAIVDDKEVTDPTEPITEKDPAEPIATNSGDAAVDQTTAVKGEYHLGANMGGALSGDVTSLVSYVSLFAGSFLILVFFLTKRHKQ